MINPTNVTNYDRGDAELQAFWIFCLFVAGKNSDRAGDCLKKFLARYHDRLPFEALKELGETGIHNLLVVNKVGQYTRMTRAIMESLDLDLRTCTLQDLLGIYGAGNKTARFFLLHSRPDMDLAVLDTHILTWLRDRQAPNVPKVTPTNPREYVRLEMIFLEMTKSLYPHLSSAKVDLAIWADQSGRKVDE